MPGGANMQPEPRPSPQNVFGGPGKLHVAEVIGFPLVKLRQKLLAQVRYRVGTAQDVRDAGAVRMRVAV